MNFNRTRAKALIAALGAGYLVVGAIAPATAKDEATRANAYIAAIKACQSMADDKSRLACFDQAAGKIVTASEQGDLAMVDREEVRQTRRKLFGFSLPDFGIFGHREGDQDEEEISVLNTTIASVSSVGYGGLLIKTAEGAWWQIDNPPRRLMTPKVGQPVEIRNAALSSYFIRINGQGGVKGTRVR